MSKLEDMSREEMENKILNSPMAEVRGVEKVKEMIGRHDTVFLKHMYNSMIDDEELAMMN